MIFIIIAVVIYILSVIGSYKFFQMAHSKGGRWSNINSEWGDLIMVILPLANTIYTIDFLLGGCYEDDDLRKKNVNKFFRVQK